MRHGSVDYFDSAGNPVRPDTVPLSPNGREQALAAGDEFARLGVHFDRVIVSGLPRTIETASLVLSKLSRAPSTETQHALREIEGGKYADIKPETMKEAFLGAFSAVADPEARFLGGEKIADFLARVVPPVDALRADPTWDCVLLVLHGGVNRALLSYLLTGDAKLYGGFAQDPACINAIDVGAEKHDAILRVVNYAPLDRLQTQTRKTTMEELLEKFVAYRNRKPLGS
ncbi:MAG: histidine phosphatase family protein [Betaproteobacteria bacterium]|nr:MAG: histidine phosphatase family protein [Betaproteobacteria bacterium]